VKFVAAIRRFLLRFLTIRALKYPLKLTPDLLFQPPCKHELYLFHNPHRQQ
jgi:hypothetical protein